MRFSTDEVTWYEDGSLFEWYVDENPIAGHRTKTCTLEQAITLAWKRKKVLVIQPAYQNECIFADFTIGDENESI